MKRIRTFVGIHFEKEVQLKIGGLISDLDLKLSNIIRWTPLQNIHLTLKFLGEIPIVTIEAIENNLREGTPLQDEFVINLENLGTFPNKYPTQIIWLGVTESLPLNNLYQLVEKSSIQAGIEMDSRSFKPHLTIGRVRKGITQNENKIILETIDHHKNCSIGVSKVTEVTLFQSILSQTGPRYIPIRRVTLREKVR